jgi:hypothetical protein
MKQLLLAFCLLLALTTVNHAAGKTDVPSTASANTEATLVAEGFQPDGVLPASATDQLNVVLSTVESSKTTTSSPETTQPLRLVDVAEFEQSEAGLAQMNADSLTAEEASDITRQFDESDSLASLSTVDATETLVASEVKEKTPSTVATPSGAATKIRGCHCALREESGGGWANCFSGCLSSWGVSPAMLIMCGGSCGLGAVPVCALCVGVSVSIATLCAIGCDIYAM